MYQIITTTGDVVTATEDVRYVKFNEDTKCWIRTRNKDEAQCIAVNGVRYSLAGREVVEDAPIVVYVREIDGATAHFQTEKNLGVTQRDLQDIAWGMQKMAQEIVEMLDAASEVMDVSAELLNVTKE